MSVCLCVLKRFKLLIFYSFCPILVKLGTYDLCADMQKLWFQNFVLKIFGEFFSDFFQVSLLLTFFSDSHETWHT